ncbi:MAG: exo-alpha-sialidase, partial [Planctomycetota bacterium]
MLQFLVSCLLMVCSEPAGEESPRDWWIGYSESRNDLPEGQFANWITRRAYVVRADGSQRRSIGAELASQEHSWTQFAGWSPDGRHAIVYSSWEDPANAQWEREHKTFRMTEGWLVDSCLVDINNGSIQNLTSSKRVSIYNTGLFFLPDGKGYGFTALLDGISKPFQMDFDGGNKRDVSGGGTGFSYGYSASPDGSRISYHEDYQVFIANSDGSNKRRIETGNPFNFVPQWSPDGQWLMFLSGEHYNCHPHIVRNDGSGLRKLADRGGYSGVVEVLKHPDFHSSSSDIPVWSPDSKSIYYTSKIGDSIELMRADLEGKTKQLTQSKPGARHYHPAVSPNGKWILFGSDRSGTMQLYVADLDSNRFENESLWPITDVPEGHCAMHGSWQTLRLPSAEPLAPKIVTVAKSASDYTRKSEGDVIELADGRLLLVYMEFAGDGSDFAKTRLVAQESSDQGRSWGKHRVITETAPGDLNVYSPNLIRARDGGILLVFMRQHRPGSLTNLVWKSNDEGQSFAALSEFVPKQNFSLCNGTIKRLSSGRLLLPASPPLPGKPAETGPYSATTLFSDDDGITWQVSPSRIALPKRGAMEPHVEETGDGRVLMVMRNQLGKL